MGTGAKTGWIAAFAGAAAAVTASTLTAQPVATDVVVRAVAHDAKVVGSSMGGARITIRDAATGAVLAEGVQEGGTGDTDRIMRRPHERGAVVYGTDDAAAFRATVELEAPTVVVVDAEGPLGVPHAARTASRTLLLLPGEHVTGEGVVLVLQGLVVRIASPAAGGGAAGDGAARVRADRPVPVRATVEMMCGCPLTPGGLWDADGVEVTARLATEAGRTAAETTLHYAGEPSTFEGELPAPPAPGAYEIRVTAAQRDAGNFGSASLEVRAGGG